MHAHGGFLNYRVRSKPALCEKRLKITSVKKKKKKKKKKAAQSVDVLDLNIGFGLDKYIIISLQLR